MSIARNRTRSAGAHKMGMTADVLTLQDTVVHLQQQLLLARNDSQKVKDQLNCLITLVKQAWSGDKSAVLHVANIVGVAPPDITQDATQDQNHIVVTAKPKGRAVNNWARLTVGLVNREYCHLEQETEDKLRHHLHNRQSFLDGQVERGYQRPVNHDHWQIVHKPVSQPPPTPTQNGHSHHISPNISPEQSVHSATKKPTIRHLYRPANQVIDKGHHPVNWASDNRVTEENKQQECLYDRQNQRVNSSRHISYMDPARYNKNDLFDEESALGGNAMNNRRRPTSGKDQRQTDMLRSRPKSAVLPKGERPLRFETTRPISATNKARRGGLSAVGRRASTGDLRKRPQSSKTTKDKTFLTNQPDDENKEDQGALPEDSTTVPQTSPRTGDSDEDSWDSVAEEREQRRREAEAILVKIKRPESITKFEDDLSNMQHMEDDFKARTISLQKKLGISPEGLVL